MALQKFTNPDNKTGVVELNECKLPKSVSDYESRINRIPLIDKYYVDLGIQYRLAQLIDSKINAFKNDIPIHVALKGHMGTGKDHDIEQFAAKLKFPYYRIPLSGEVRDVTLLGSVQLYGDGKGGTESRWQDGELTRALRGPAIVNLSELNAAGPEVLFALHSLLDRHKKLELPNGEVIELRDDTFIFGTMNPTSLRDYAGTQSLNKAFADRWVIWDKPFPKKEQLESIFSLRYPKLQKEYVELIIKLAIEINNSFVSDDISVNVETPMSLRTIVERIPVGLNIYKNTDDPLKSAWEHFVLPHVNKEDLDHYNTLWNTIVRKGPSISPKL
ncbi:MAG: AAA family ATPase [Candidatus Actinomarina sp.]|tara:strand:- start:308 stop:1297 length:990 start_codon:yes stop_codon:yes gene_type:complete